MRSKRVIAAARSSGLLRSKKMPVTPSTIVSTAPPARYAMVGRPAAAISARHAKIFFAGKYRAPGSGRPSALLQHPRAGPGRRRLGRLSHEACSIRPVTDDQQPTSQQRARLDGKIDALVGNQPREHQIVIVLFREGGNDQDQWAGE